MMTSVSRTYEYLGTQDLILWPLLSLPLRTTVSFRAGSCDECKVSMTSGKVCSFAGLPICQSN